MSLVGRFRLHNRERVFGYLRQIGSPCIVQILLLRQKDAALAPISEGP
jgi:hypothetical protein